MIQKTVAGRPRCSDKLEWKEKHLEDKLTTLLRHKAKRTEIVYRTDDLVQLQEVVSVLNHRKLKGTAQCHRKTPFYRHLGWSPRWTSVRGSR